MKFNKYFLILKFEDDSLYYKIVQSSKCGFG